MENIDSNKVLSILAEDKEFFETGETKSIDFRITQLKKLKFVIKDNEELIMEALKMDLNKSQFESYAAEVGYLYDSISYFIRNLKKWVKVKKVKTPIIHFGSKSYIYPEPYGTVLIIGPFNYPFQLLMEPLVGAIAAGNCIVLKPSEFTPNVSKLIGKLIKENFNEKFIRVIEGGIDITSALINAPFDYIFFTGSVKVGKIVMKAAARNLIPVTLELGGKSPCIVNEDANLNVAAERIAWGKFMNVGQTCVAPDYVLVHKNIKEHFIKKIIEKVKDFYGYDPMNSEDYGRIVNESHMRRLIDLIDIDKVVLGGKYDINERYMAPTILDNVTLKDKVMEEEIFGPILPIIEYEDIKEAIKLINKRDKPLALYLFTENKLIQKTVEENVSYGGGCINDTMTHLVTPYLPFGGVGPSGVGSYHGYKSFETFSHMKSILKKSTKININFIYPPYNNDKLKLLKKAMK
ncbi:aldehyde dehydrogenase [Candidatus Clostridium stratigraminis]|uniref:Aldehyde dehydrogenase n=1 Tax=Candidatus Clostridium stratigraminis TaxID=3381661 RepID=A0ABW8T235_9CLOT